MQSQVGTRHNNTMSVAALPPPAASPQVMASTPYGAQQPYQGTLAPGTRVMIGQIVVTVQKYLSQGGFAHVYLVTTDKPIAMPVSATSKPGSTSATTRGETLHVLKRMAVPDKEALAGVRSEVDVHRSLRNHPNIVHFIEASATALQGGGYEIFILMEYCSGGGIIDLMNSRLRNRLTEPEVLKIFGDVAAGLSVMHHMDPPLLHRDLKVENILLAPPPRSNPSAGPTYKLCDFGSTIPILSRRAPKSLEEVKRLEADLNKHTTLQYRAPEMVDVYQRRIIDEKADVWAMGVLLYKLCYYTTPFEENGGGPLAILNARYRFPNMPAYSQRLKDLIASMLQEQSTSRPTIDQVIIGIHRISGTAPPASATHYANLAANGKQMQPLPNVVSNSGKPSSGSAADVAAMAMAKQQHTAKGGYGPAGGVDQNLIEMGPSAAERKKVEEEEFKKRNEGIVPMRRGRPNRPAGTVAEAHPRTTSPFKVANSTSPPSSQTAKQQEIPSLGFSDSFSPPKTTNGLTPAPPSRPGSGMQYSPLMPGMDISNRASPMPKPVSPLAPSPQSASQDEEASSRFPSVAELDLQYRTDIKERPSSSSSRTPITSPPIASSSLPSSQSRSNVIPGLSERAPVSAMAGKFGNMSSSASSRLSNPSTATTSPNVTGKLTGGGSSSLAKRWPHQQEAGSSSSTASVTSSREMPPPALPSRKPRLKDWLMEDNVDEGKVASPAISAAAAAAPNPLTTASEVTTAPASARELDVEEAESSDEDEAEKPEDVDRPVVVAEKRQGLMGKSLFEERREAARDRNSNWMKPSSSMTSTPSTGKIKKPDWLQQQQQSNVDEGIPETKLRATPTLQSEAASPSQAEEPNRDEVMTLKSGVSAAAPAWDEDDEEMHFLPQPDLSNNVRYGQVISNTTSYQPKKVYADASTSPGRGSPVIVHPSPPAAIPPTPTTSRTAPPVVAKDQKPKSFVSPRPIRSQTTKDVGGLVSKYQSLDMNKSEDSNSSTTVASSSGSRNSIVVQSRDVGITPIMSQQESGRDDNRMTEQRKNSLKTISNSSGPPPPINSSKPNTWSSRRESGIAKRSDTLKPWEREAAEKEQVEIYGSLRSASPSKGESEDLDERVGGNAKGNHEAQERFTGVSSLISQWQANSSKGAPGWGTVGGGGDSISSTNSRPRTKDEEDLLKRSSTIGIGSGRRAVHGRLASRDV